MVCECERGDDASISRALQMFQGKLIHRMLTDEDNRIHQALEKNDLHAEILRNLYIHALCREPTDGELSTATRYIGSKEDAAVGLEDVAWALINSNEFLFQH